MKKKLLLIPIALLALGSAFALAVATQTAPSVAQAPTQAHVRLHVEGMHCASCPLTVRAALQHLDGVSDATVSMSDQRADVTYDPHRVSPEQMSHAVTEAGYPARVEAQPEQPNP